MRTITGLVLAVIAALSTPLALAPAVHADTEMSGRWISDSLRDNRVGYHFTLRSGSDGYAGMLRFTHRDGRRPVAIPITAAVRGDSMTLRADSGAFDRSSGPLRAVVSEDASTLTLTNCRARLRLVMVNDLDSDCVFRRAAPSKQVP